MILSIILWAIAGTFVLLSGYVISREGKVVVNYTPATRLIGTVFYLAIAAAVAFAAAKL